MRNVSLTNTYLVEHLLLIAAPSADLKFKKSGKFGKKKKFM